MLGTTPAAGKTISAWEMLTAKVGGPLSQEQAEDIRRRVRGEGEAT